MIQTLLSALLLATSIIPAPHAPPTQPPRWFFTLAESRLGFEIPQQEAVVECAFGIMSETEAFQNRDRLLTAVAEECERMRESGFELSAIWCDRRGTLIRIRLQFSPE